MSSTQDLKAELEQAVDGLEYPSDADSPVRVDIGPASPSGTFQPTGFLEHLGKAADQPIEEVPAATFFGELRSYPAFQRLYKLLQERLQDLQVFRVGTVHVDVYILGRDPGGNLVTLSTRSLET